MIRYDRQHGIESEPEGRHAPRVTNLLLTLEEVAERLRVSRISVMRWVRARELPATKIGKAWRISQATLERWLRMRTTRAGDVQAPGWSREEALDTRRRLARFEDDWNAPGMEAYDEL